MPGEEPISWRAITLRCPVISSDDETVGELVDVAAMEDEDIFHGIVFTHSAKGIHLLAPAKDIALITGSAVHLSVPLADTFSYQPFHELDIERMGLKGLFKWKHVVWKHQGK